MTHYQDKDKINAAYLYAASGNYSQVARQANINRKTIMTWASDWSDWDASLDRARQEISSELLAQNLKIALTANDAVLDRLENGDTKLTAKGAVKVPMTGKDCAVVGGIMQDKGRVQMGMATSITSTDSIKGLAARFDAMAQAHKRIQADHDNIQDSVISTQVNEAPIETGGGGKSD